MSMQDAWSRFRVDLVIKWLSCRQNSNSVCISRSAHISHDVVSGIQQFGYKIIIAGLLDIKYAWIGQTVAFDKIAFLRCKC